MGEQMMSQQQDIADAAYERLRNGPIPISDLVRELREKWGAEFGVSAVHGFVREVATCLLHREVEIGEVIAGRFVPWGLEPWDADEKIDHDLMSMDAFFEDDSRYVFRSKQMPIKPPQHNAGSRPSSGDSLASETPSSLGPRG